MDNDVESGCRPTLRTLTEQLLDPSAWKDPEQIRAIVARNFRGVLPLSKLSHPIIQAGHALTSDAESSHNLIVYQHSVALGLPSVWRELRRDQWRGLVTQPAPSKEWWLIHAGLRRQGDRNNVYKLTDSSDATELMEFLPTQDDLELLKIEKSVLAQLRWKSACLVALIDSIVRVGQGEVGSDEPAALPVNPAHPGCKLHFSVTLERLAEDDETPSSELPAEIFVSIRIDNWSDEVVRQAIVPLMMGFIDPAQENWTAFCSADKTTTYWVMVSESRLAQLIAAAAIPSHSTPVRNLSCAAPETRHGHYVPRDPLVDAFVSGGELRALCGKWFVPTKDHSGLPICGECERAFALLP